MVSKIDGRELRVKKAMKSWARMRNISSEKQLLLCPTWSREWVGDGQEGGLETSQARLEEAVAEVTATSSAHRTQKHVQDSGRGSG